MQLPNPAALTPKQKEDLVTLICFKHQKHNILNLRKVVGDEGLLSLFNKFAGLYTRFPSISHIVRLANELQLVSLYEDLKSAAVNGTAVQWQEAEAKFIKFAESKFGFEYRSAKIQVKKMKKHLEESRNWYAGIDNWEKRNQNAEQS